MSTTNPTGTPENPSASSGVDTIESTSTLWTTGEVSHYLHVSPKTVFNLRKRGLPCILLGGAVRFFPQEIKDYLTSHRQLASHRLRHIVRGGIAQ